MDHTVLRKAYELGHEFERKYHGCAQCVIGAVYELFPEMRSEDIFRSANAQAGGQLYGRSLGNIEDPEKQRFHAYRLGAEFQSRFIEEMSSLTCGDIQKTKMGRSFNLLDPDDWEEFERLGGHESHCPDVVGVATRIVVQIILEQKGKT